MNKEKHSLTTTQLPPAPPIVEYASYEGDPGPMPGYAIPGEHPEGHYIVQRRETLSDGTEALWLTTSNDIEGGDSFFAQPIPKPFRVSASKIRRTYKVSWYDSWPFTSPGLAEIRRQIAAGHLAPTYAQDSFELDATRQETMRRNLIALFGAEAVEAELDRIETLGATEEERATAWAAEKQALTDAGLIPDWSGVIRLSDS